jgi:hypothetical protein
MQANSETNNKKIFIAGMLFITSFYVFGCGDSMVSPLSQRNSIGNLTLSLKSSGSGNDDPLNIVIDQAKLLVKKVEFEVQGTENESEVEEGPFVINIDLAGGVKEISAGTIPSGTYDKVKFQIHKPDDNETPPDPEFKDGNSGNQRYSFIIKGTINGEPFVYKSKKSIDLSIDLVSPVNVQNIQNNITVLLTQRIWFLINGNTVDPREPSHENEIDDNLKNSFSQAYKDDDRNGELDRNN